MASILWFIDIHWLNFQMFKTGFWSRTDFYCPKRWRVAWPTGTEVQRGGLEPNPAGEAAELPAGGVTSNESFGKPSKKHVPGPPGTIPEKPYFFVKGFGMVETATPEWSWRALWLVGDIIQFNPRTLNFMNWMLKTHVSLNFIEYGTIFFSANVCQWYNVTMSCLQWHPHEDLCQVTGAPQRLAMDTGNWM